jgi:anti-anti-sigma factor
VQVSKDQQGNALILRFGSEIVNNKASGEIELDIDNNYVLTEAIEKDLESGKKDFILDLESISYIDSSGLGAIFDSYKQITEAGGKISLLNPTADVKRVLDITQISKKIKIFSNEKEAVDNLS